MRVVQLVARLCRDARCQRVAARAAGGGDGGAATAAHAALGEGWGKGVVSVGSGVGSAVWYKVHAALGRVGWGMGGGECSEWGWRGVRVG